MSIFDITIYQTVEHRHDQTEEALIAQGPIFCESDDAWLGSGYYFWDSRIEDAHWWGKHAYIRKNKSYRICQAQMTLNRLTCFDLLGCIDHVKEFFFSIDTIQKHQGAGSGILVEDVLCYMRSLPNWNYGAIRAEPSPTYSNNKSNVKPHAYFPGLNFWLAETNKVQICINDKAKVNFRQFCVVTTFEIDRNDV